MKLTSLLALPPTILILCAAEIAAEPQWPHNLPKHMKYFPEDEEHVKRGLDIKEKLRQEKPIGVKKMSRDEGEMFFLDNWIFASDNQDAAKRSEPPLDLANVTGQFQSPLRPLAEASILDSFLRFRARSALMKRDFKCPENTNDCSSIGAPNSCCGSGTTCISIEDNGFGSVGCCAEGESCSGGISCDTANGYTSCPKSSNGGCCLPGFSCQDVGCIVVGTSVTFVQPSTSTTLQPTSSTAVIVVPTTQSATSSSSTSLACSTDWFSCPASLGGGCCQSGQQCATGTSCIESSTSSVAPSAPVRPTSGSSTTTSEPSSSFPGESVCPTGFYVCSAYYPSGCCRVGRDCQTTGSCAPTSSGTIVDTNGVTVVAPTGAGLASTAAPQGGSCPNNWYSCAANRGGNCCPAGYSCGEQCTATAGTSVSQKVAPSAATIPSIVSIWALVSGFVAIGAVMVVL